MPPNDPVADTPPPVPLPEADAAASASGRGKILLGVSGSAGAPRRASGARDTHKGGWGQKGLAG